MNHLKDLRVAHGLRQLDLAMEAGCGRTAVLRMEQLVYPEPLPNVLSALSDITGESVVRLRNLYLSDVSDHRYFSGQKWRLSEIHGFGPDVMSLQYGKRFELLRKAWARNVGEPDSQVHFCMAFSIHPAVLSKYESGATNHLPRGVLDALLGAGLGQPEVDYLAVSPEFNGDREYHD
jgi:transcriptional regulator with XRE-family HTH domain